jgi:hypothetical protein
MTHPSRPNGQQPVQQDHDLEEMPTYVSPRLMATLSVVVVVALILGSATAVFALTDWGLNVAAIIGLAMAALLVVLWLRLPGAGSRK